MDMSKASVGSLSFASSTEKFYLGSVHSSLVTVLRVNIVSSR